MLCTLAHTRKLAVPGEGPAPAPVMLIGEGPGRNEDEQGRPFVGASGKFLEELLAAAGLQRAQVYITNVVKCRPPENRDPLPAEVAACAGYLERQIELVDPRVIVTLGRFSMARWFPVERISAIHGQARQFGARLVVPMFHPAAALHQPKIRPQLLEDFAKLPQLIAQAAPATPRSAANVGGSTDQQLDLF
ncbi:uracil-DNA glycosylase [Anaerolineae bacterium]|nr:hypothetical protein EMGBS3_05010 [Anaerolineaceae bacterium]GBL38398.1 hypothetical protein EMGBD1_20850 [Anaerolineaceae bacterium]GDX68074.1 uracil-DNA glycosylase [Anaerolineae bacterium]